MRINKKRIEFLKPENAIVSCPISHFIFTVFIINIKKEN